VFIGVGLLIWTAGLGFAGSSKLSPDLLQADPDSTVDIIVQFTGVPTETDHQRIREHGAELKKELPVVKGALYSVPARKLEGLSENPRVVYISPDRPVWASLDLSAAAVNASVAWQWGFVGKGIGVAVIDSGISNHDDLKTVICLNPPSCTSYTPSSTPRVVYNQDFVGGGTDDHYGHGEHVAGIVAGDGIDSSCSICTRAFRGIGPYANLINLRVLDQNGQGTDSAVISALQQAIKLSKQYKIGVINLSLGRPVFESYTQDPLCKAVEAAWKSGIVVVVAAGNYGRNNSMGTSGYATITAPGNDPYVITVGAMKTMGTPQRSDDLIASYSSKGPTLIDHVVKPDIVAPGNRLVSLLASTATLPALYPQNLIPLSYYEQTGSTALSNGYYQLSGTSMAAAAVSGAVAVLLQAQPNLTPTRSRRG